ncbi:hypothetical protein RQP46_002664 [Phenoliferia psychrophenolica]
MLAGSRSVSFVLAATALATSSWGRTITVKNSCSYTVYPAIFTSGGTVPDHVTGWEALAGSTESFTTADDWNGRVWPRTHCDFSTSSTDPSTCGTGGCNGGLQCDKSGGTGVPPVTLAEFNFNGGGVDWYDVSGVDGTNVPTMIENTAGCDVPKCAVDLNEICPEDLQVSDSAGDVIGCYSACAKNGDNNASNSPNCCSGSYDTPSTCPSSGVEGYTTFKAACPSTYFYAYDDKTSLFTCTSSLEADYTVTPLQLPHYQFYVASGRSLLGIVVLDFARRCLRLLVGLPHRVFRRRKGIQRRYLLHLLHFPAQSFFFVYNQCR